MVKKRKKLPTTPSNSPKTVAASDFCALQKEIIQHLQALRESGRLVVGCNAVLRGIEKGSLTVVILVSKRATSSMYHALHLMSIDKDALFLQLPDIDPRLRATIPASTAYGIKATVATDPRFSKLSVKIDQAKRLQQSNKAKKSRNSTSEKVEKQPDQDLENKEGETDDDSKEFVHPRHDVSKRRFIGNAEAFISLGEYSESEIDFPNYKRCSDEISFVIQ